MPDPKFKFSEAEIALAEKEVEHFFTEILTKNLPMTDFIRFSAPSSSIFAGVPALGRLDPVDCIHSTGCSRQAQ